MVNQTKSFDGQIVGVIKRPSTRPPGWVGAGRISTTFSATGRPACFTKKRAIKEGINPLQPESQTQSGFQNCSKTEWFRKCRDHPPLGTLNGENLTVRAASL